MNFKEFKSTRQKTKASTFGEKVGIPEDEFYSEYVFEYKSSVYIDILPQDEYVLKINNIVVKAKTEKGLEYLEQRLYRYCKEYQYIS